MDYQRIFERILRSVDEQAYTISVDRVPANEREALRPFGVKLQSGDFDADQLGAEVRQLHAQGRIDRVKMLSALHMIAAHPRVADWGEAARLAGEQELAALDLGGPELQANLASVDRHRGVLAFLRGHHEVALDYFARVIERERTGNNLGNVLATLLRLGEVEDAVALLQQISQSYPEDVVRELMQRVRTDPDLSLLNTEGHQ